MIGEDKKTTLLQEHFMREIDSGIFTRLSGKELMVQHLRSFMEKYEEMRQIRGLQIKAEIELAVDTFGFEVGEEWATQFQEVLELYVNARGVPEDAHPIVSPEDVCSIPPTGVVAEKNRVHNFAMRVKARLRGIFGS